MNEWLETGGLLGHFGRKLKEPITNYKSYVEEVDEGPIKNPIKEESCGFVLVSKVTISCFFCTENCLLRDFMILARPG